MPIIKWEPFSDLERFFEERPYVSLFPKLGWDLAVDVFEEGGNVIAKMNLPGIDPDKLDISVDEDELTIAGSREEEQEADEKEYYSKEIRRGSFTRTVSLPRVINESRVDAVFNDGVLTVTMPAIKGKEEEATKVTVKKS